MDNNSNIDKELRYDIINQTLENSEIPLFWCEKGRFIMLNAAFCQLTGYTKEELLGLNFDDITAINGKQTPLNSLFTNNQEREAQVFIWVLKTKDERKVSTEIRLTRLYEHNIPYYFGIIRNLSDKETNVDLFEEEKESLRMALRFSSQGMWEWNINADETYYSPEYYEMLGYENDAFNPNYRNWAAMIHPEDVDKAVAIWDDFENSDNDTYHDEFRLKKKSGEYIWVSTEGRVMQRDETGKPLRIIGIVANIHNRKLAEIKIQEQTQKLVDYAFFNSHNLRAPLSTILGLVEVLKFEQTEEVINSLEIVSKQLDQVVHEINNILIGDSAELSANTKFGPVKKISLVGEDKIFHIVYKKTFEKYATGIETTTHQKAVKVLELLQSKILETDLILIDLSNDADAWGLLTEFEKLENRIPIYLLTDSIKINDALMASKYKTVKGILLKPLSKQSLLNVINLHP